MKNTIFTLDLEKLDKVNGGSTTRVPSKFTALRELRGSVVGLAGTGYCHPGLMVNNAQYSFGRVEAPLF